MTMPTRLLQKREKQVALHAYFCTKWAGPLPSDMKLLFTNFFVAFFFTAKPVPFPSQDILIHGMEISSQPILQLQEKT